MKKIEFIIRSSKFEAVNEALNQLGIKGMTVTHVLGFGLQKGRTEVYRGNPVTANLLPKTKVELVISDNLVEKAIELIIKEARTGAIGDGKIFVSSIENAIRIRTGETGDDVV